MKILSIFFLLFFLSILIFLISKCHENGTKPLDPCNAVGDSNLICNESFDSYIGLWKTWWKDSIHSIPFKGSKDSAYFTISREDLDSVSKLQKNPGAVELYYTFNDSTLLVKAILSSKTSSFKNDTLCWYNLISRHLGTKNIPIGVKLHSTDLQNLYNLSKCPNVTCINGYFGFHTKDDVDSNRMIVIFRPIFNNSPVRKNNCDINCSCPSKAGTSFINIDFTNPCPPCNSSQ